MEHRNMNHGTRKLMITRCYTPQEWLWHWVTDEGWYAIKQRNQNLRRETELLLLFLESFFSHQRQLVVFHWSLRDSKSPQVSMTLLSILTNLNNAVVWMVSIFPLIFNFQFLFWFSIPPAFLLLLLLLLLLLIIIIIIIIIIISFALATLSPV